MSGPCTGVHYNAMYTCFWNVRGSKGTTRTERKCHVSLKPAKCKECLQEGEMVSSTSWSRIYQLSLCSPQSSSLKFGSESRGFGAMPGRGKELPDGPALDPHRRSPRAREPCAGLPGAPEPPGQPAEPGVASDAHRLTPEGRAGRRPRAPAPLPASPPLPEVPPSPAAPAGPAPRSRVLTGGRRPPAGPPPPRAPPPSRRAARPSSGPAACAPAARWGAGRRPPAGPRGEAGAARAGRQRHGLCQRRERPSPARPGPGAERGSAEGRKAEQRKGLEERGRAPTPASAALLSLLLWPRAAAGSAVPGKGGRAGPGRGDRGGAGRSEDPAGPTPFARGRPGKAWGARGVGPGCRRAKARKRGVPAGSAGVRGTLPPALGRRLGCPGGS